MSLFMYAADRSRKGSINLKNHNYSDSFLKEIIEDLIMAAHADAKNKVKLKASEEFSKITDGIPQPPGFKFPL